MKRISWFNYKLKLITSYLIFCIVPLLLTTFIIYNVAKDNLQTSTLSFMELYTSQISHNLNTNIEMLDNLSQTIYYNQNILQYLLETKNISPVDATEKKIAIDQTLNSFSSQNSNIFGITIISAKGKIFDVGYGSEVVLPNLISQDWYASILEANGELVITSAHYVPYTIYDDRLKVITVGRVFKDIRNSNKGVLLFDIKPNDLANTVITDLINNDYHTRVVITNPQNELIYDSDIESSPYTSFINHPDYLTSYQHSSVTNLNVYTIVDKVQLFSKTVQMLRLVQFIIFISVLVIIMFSLIWSQTISSPIMKLAKSMRKVENGDYELLKETDRIDEIGILINTYNKMLRKTKVLIEDVYLAKLNKQEAELSALQMQINPHMLYNTLEAIRMKSIINNDLEVSNMIKLLGKMFRLSLDRVKGPNYIKNELTYITTHIQLQNIRYEGRFHLDIHIPPEILQRKIIPFVFQPIIENAIIHGFKDKKENCIISISCQPIEKNTLITITDNGCGIDKETLASLNFKMQQNIMTTTGIGLTNIVNRLRLNYGEKYRFTILSNEDEDIGTTIELIVPVI